MKRIMMSILHQAKQQQQPQSHQPQRQRQRALRQNHR